MHLQCTSNATALLQCTYNAPAMPLQFPCNASAMPLQCPCNISTMHLQFFWKKDNLRFETASFKKKVIQVIG